MVLDDPQLALIVRFVLGERGLRELKDGFVQRQLQTLQEYVTAFPEEERNKRAMEWIERHAEAYRRQWQKRTLTNYAPGNRCDDCPLSLDDQSTPCEVHQRWLQLLEKYSKRELETSEYVEHSLALLRQQKSRLKVSLTEPGERREH